MLRAAGLVTGSYHAGCEPLSARIRVNGEPVAPELLAQAAETLSARETLPRAAAELAAAARCFGEAGCALAVVELPDAGLAEALPKMPVCAVTSTAGMPTPQAVSITTTSARCCAPTHSRSCRKTM